MVLLNLLVKLTHIPVKNKWLIKKSWLFFILSTETSIHPSLGGRALELGLLGRVRGDNGSLS